MNSIPKRPKPREAIQQLELRLPILSTQTPTLQYPLPGQRLRFISKLELPQIEWAGFSRQKTSAFVAPILQSLGSRPRRSCQFTLLPEQKHPSTIRLEKGFRLAVWAMLSKQGVEDKLFWGDVSADGRVLDCVGMLEAIRFGLEKKILHWILPSSARSMLIRQKAFLETQFSAYPDTQITWLDKIRPRTEISKIRPERWSQLPLVATERLPTQRYKFSKAHSEIKTLVLAGDLSLLLLGGRGESKSLLLRAIDREMMLLNPSEQWASRVIDVDSDIQSTRHPRITFQASFGPKKIEQLDRGKRWFIHELPLLSPSALHALRHSLEETDETASRSLSPPRVFATGNLCPCGAPFDSDDCMCSPFERQQFRHRLPRPLTDRFQIFTWIGAAKTSLHQTGAMELAGIKAVRSWCRQTYGDLPGRLSPLQLDQILNDLGAHHSALDAAPNYRTRHQWTRIALTLASLRKKPPDPQDFLDSRCYHRLDWGPQWNAPQLRELVKSGQRARSKI